MNILNISGELPWKGSLGRRKKEDIKFVLLHHDASLAGDVYDAKKLYAQEANYHISKGWGHLGYSFRIARDGTIYQTVPYEEIGAHAGNYKYFRNSMGVCLDGSFDKQKPSDAQIKALRDFMDHLSYHSPELPGVVRKSWYSHKEVRTNPTFCCGPDITKIVQNYRNTK
jgi:N-acetyl-anhydromuramyl-L-alanine amidase AmpD